MEPLSRNTAHSGDKRSGAREHYRKTADTPNATCLQYNYHMVAEVCRDRGRDITSGSSTHWNTLGWNQGDSDRTFLTSNLNLLLLTLVVSQVAIHDQKTQVEVLARVAYLSKLICRYAVFEEIYLQHQSSLQESLKLELTAALRALYMAVLKYLVETLLYLNHSSRGQLRGSPVTRSSR